VFKTKHRFNLVDPKPGNPKPDLPYPMVPIEPDEPWPRE
jgi:hypothetical protein